MGEFIAASGVIGSDVGAVRGALEKILASPDCPELLEDEQFEIDELVLATGQRGVTVMYSGFFTGYGDLSRQLSSILGVPVFAFHIHDGDLWMYEFFVGGQLVDQFNPWPRYWTRKMKHDDVVKWTGQAAAVCAHIPGMDRDAIERYLVSWEDDSGDLVRSGKAYAQDSFTYGDSWQLLDFMAKIGLTLPDPPPEPEPDPAEVVVRSRYAHDAQLRYLRTQAERAWQEKNYRGVADVYSSLNDALSEVERRKLEYSKKKLETASPEVSSAPPEAPRAQVVRRPWWKLW